MKRLWYLLSISLIIASCGEDIEGCLDPEATNFDPSADVTCCCEYPQLTFKMSYNNYAGDSTTFALNSLYNDDDGTPYYINDLNLYISDFELVRSDNSVETVIDTIGVTLKDGMIRTLQDDFSILSNNIFQYDIGTTNISGDFTKIRFKIGLNDVASQVNPESVETTHPLSSDNGLYENDAYVFNKIAIIADTSMIDIITNYNVISNAVNIELNHDFTINSGFDTEISINADLKKLLNTVDFQNDDYDAIISKIVTNTSDIFTIVE
ncbi:MAG: MbnP family protein [Saprospiraceae bacterium]